MLRSWEEPGHEVHGADGHADAEDDSGKRSLCPAFAERENEPADHNGDEREAGGDRASEGILQNLNSVLPRRKARLLGECVFGNGQTCGECQKTLSPGFWPESC